jgi:hypothetical protein
VTRFRAVIFANVAIFNPTEAVGVVALVLTSKKSWNIQPDAVTSKALTEPDDISTVVIAFGVDPASPIALPPAPTIKTGLLIVIAAFILNVPVPSMTVPPVAGSESIAD